MFHFASFFNSPADNVEICKIRTCQRHNIILVDNIFCFATSIDTLKSKTTCNSVSFVLSKKMQWFYFIILFHLHLCLHHLPLNYKFWNYAKNNDVKQLLLHTIATKKVIGSHWRLPPRHFLPLYERKLLTFFAWEGHSYISEIRFVTLQGKHIFKR